jgi:CMP-N-acetylneuraminic acid synthetase
MQASNIGKPKITALVPMRHSSERVKGKNYRNIAGIPLFHHIIKSLTACPEINQVVVNTDSEVIIDGLKNYFPNVLSILRPGSLRDGLISMNKILEYDLEHVAADYYLQTHSTNPLLKTSTISNAIQSFLNQREIYDSLFSVTRLQTRLYDIDHKPINHNPEILLRTQDLPPVYEENSCLYIFSKNNFLRRNNRIGDNPLLFEIDADEAWDIDEELDFKITEFLLQQSNNNKSKS